MMQRMVDNNIDDSKIIQIRGYKNLSYVNAYSTPTGKRHQNVSM